MAKYSRDAASKCMKIHMAQDKYIMGNNRLSRAKKTVTVRGWLEGIRTRETLSTLLEPKVAAAIQLSL